MATKRILALFKLGIFLVRMPKVLLNIIFLLNQPGFGFSLTAHLRCITRSRRLRERCR